MKAFLFVFLLGIAKDPKFPAIEVSLHGSPAVRFSFSAADASSSSPVIISVPGRALTNGDCAHRVDLQKHWLSVHVPKNLTFRIRTLDECEYKHDGEFNGADHYVFEDAAERGEWLAAIQVARMYRDGNGVPVDESSALKWYRTAASLAGEIASCAELSEAIEYGRAHSNND